MNTLKNTENAPNWQLSTGRDSAPFSLTIVRGTIHNYRMTKQPLGSAILRLYIPADIRHIHSNEKLLKHGYKTSTSQLLLACVVVGALTAHQLDLHSNWRFLPTAADLASPAMSLHTCTRWFSPTYSPLSQLYTHISNTDQVFHHLKFPSC